MRGVRVVGPHGSGEWFGGMGHGDTIEDQRASTDASLGAERATTDTATERTAANKLRSLDDRLERDRLRADDRLLKFRERADRALARERSEEPAPNSAVKTERLRADQGKEAERIATDAHVDLERRRADAVVDAQARGQAEHDARLEARRKDTDDQLSTERTETDDVVASLVEAKTARAHDASDDARRGDVLAIVAHDLRSPLSVIALNAELIAEASKEAGTVTLIQDVSLAAARMERLLSDLLDVVRVEAGAFRIVKRAHDARELVTEVVRAYQPLFVDRKVTFAAEGPVSPLVASFDHDRIVQVLSNLLGNAMKFTPPEGNVELHVEKTTDQIEFVLHDSGPGIPADALPHVFERFWQIDNHQRRGLGLGLYICEQIVGAHGGKIWAESELGKGTTFRFTLPAS